MPEQAKLKVFLCHASQDKPIVRDVYQRLSTEGWIDPWLDEEKILAGQGWEYEIEKAVESADVVIVFLSNVSINKEGYVQKEVRYSLDIALEKPEATIFIVPFRLDNCVVPRKIRHWQYVDCFSVERLDWAYKKILESLRVRAATKGINISESRFLGVDTTAKDNSIDFGSSHIRRMPVYLLLEIDDSMSGAPIIGVEQGVQLLHNELINQPQAVEMVSLSVVTYSTNARQVVPLTPITGFAPPALSAGGISNLGKALRVLGDCIFNDIIRNTTTKKSDYKALVFWMTDSEPTDDWEAGLKYLKQRTDGLLGNIIAMGCGDSVNTSVLRKITPNVLLMTDATPDNLRAFFKWQSQPTRR